jgi:hypothetical protein
MIQLFLSLVLSIGAAFGLSPKGKAELHKVGVSLHETVQAVVSNISDLTANINSKTSAKVSIEASSQNSEKTSLKVNSNLNTQVGNNTSLLGNSVSGLSFNNSSSNKTNTTVKTNPSKTGVELRDQLNSTLHVNLMSGE